MAAREKGHWAFDVETGSNPRITPETSGNSAAVDGWLRDTAVITTETAAPIVGSTASLHTDGTNDYVDMGNQNTLKIRARTRRTRAGPW